MRFVYHNCCVNQRDREVLINFEREDVSVPEDWRPTLEWTTESGEKHLDNKLDVHTIVSHSVLRVLCLKLFVSICRRLKIIIFMHIAMRF